MIRRLVIIAMLAIPLPFAAQAQESWTSAVGEIVHEGDLAGGEAILSFPGESGQRLIGFFPGLADASENRSFFAGVWIDPEATEEGPCPGAMTDLRTGGKSYDWGRLDLIFTRPEGPSGLIALKGSCFDPVTDFLIADPQED